MFIDVTRPGGQCTLRLAVTAIAYVDAYRGGASIHLIGGEELRVSEDPAVVERRIDAAIGLVPLAESPADDVAEPAAADTAAAPAARPARKNR